MNKAAEQSYWDKDIFLKADICIAGAGIIGISAALSALEKNPLRKIIVLERALHPMGASSRNAGFACFGSPTEIHSDIQLMGKDLALHIVEKRLKGLSILRSRLNDEQLGLEAYGGNEIILSEQEYILDHIQQLNQYVAPYTGLPSTFTIQGSQAIHAHGLHHSIKALIHTPAEAQIHSGRMMHNLWEMARQKGITIITGAHVQKFEEQSHSIHLQVACNGIEWSFSCPELIICTNAWMPELLPELQIKPGRGQIILTNPIPGLPLKGTFHMEEGYYYFRNLGNRILLGGGRNLDFAGEQTYQFGNTPIIQDRLAHLLNTLIIPGRTWHIEQNWSGIMGFSADKKPFTGRVSAHCIAGFGCNGMGVALGSLIGYELAELLS
jgi:glycine/D-amino acid oxidase-like deaminating enzyme